MEFCKTIRLPDWNPSFRQKVEAYWQGRGVHLQAVDDKRMAGRRGSLWGNLNSLHIAKVLTRVTITRTEEGIACVVDVDPRFRSISLHNRTYLELELAEFESYLLTGELQPQAWEAHRRAANKAMGELAGMALRHAYLRKGPMVVGGDLKFKAWLTLGGALVLSPMALLWGPKLKILLDILHGHPAVLDPLARLLFGPVLAGLFAAMCIGMALFLLRVGRTSAACVNVEQAAERLGMDTDGMRHAIAERGIQPRYILNGEPVYQMEEITGAAQLLRAAQTPVAEGLLLPTSATLPHSGEQMLRPVVGEPAAVEQVDTTQRQQTLRQ